MPAYLKVERMTKMTSKTLSKILYLTTLGLQPLHSDPGDTAPSCTSFANAVLAFFYYYKSHRLGMRTRAHVTHPAATLE
jgi:hypothetical protein